jgi:hypothetical protein
MIILRKLEISGRIEMRGWLIVVLFACVLSVGCGTSVPDPTEADVESYVKQRIGDQLFISMMALEGGQEMEMLKAAGQYEPATVDARGNFHPGSGGPPGGFPAGDGRPPGNAPPRGGFPPSGGFPPPGQSFGNRDPAGAYLEKMDQEIANQKFRALSDRPKLNATLYDCDLNAAIDSFEITNHDIIDEKTQVFEFTVTQTLGVDLMRLRTASELKKAIGWEASKTSDARTKARKLPSKTQADLQKQWLEAEKTRRYVMELVHPQGMDWTSTGKVRVRFDGEKWTFDLREMKAPDNLSSSLVTPDKALQGLMVVDPSNYEAASEEWKKPYLDFIAKVEGLHTAREKQQAARQKALEALREVGKTFTTSIDTKRQPLRITIKFTRVTEQGLLYADFIAAHDDGTSFTVSTFGSLGQFYEFELDKEKLSVSDDLVGPAFNMQARESQKLTPPWSEIKYRITVDPNTLQPLLIWSNQAKPLEGG